MAACISRLSSSASKNHSAMPNSTICWLPLPQYSSNAKYGLNFPKRNDPVRTYLYVPSGHSGPQPFSVAHGCQSYATYAENRRPAWSTVAMVAPPGTAPVLNTVLAATGLVVALMLLPMVLRPVVPGTPPPARPPRPRVLPS